MANETCGSCGAPLAEGTPVCTACGATQPGALANPWQQLLTRVAEVAKPRYRVTKLLGYGGMAGVYLAEEPRLGRRVAIKVMSPALMMDPGLVARFSQEARITAQLSHPNIATIYDVDEREGLHYFVMEYVPGRTVGQVMQLMRGERLPVGVVLHWLAQAASALSYAHRAGVVHRDIKPGNILLPADGNVRVTDFGIAKVADEPSLTRTGFLVGTPAYMSPEQCTSGTVGGASDQYSLGVVAYEMLAGRPPFTGATMAVVQAHINQEPVPISELRADCPVEVADGILRMLAKKAEDRFTSPAAAAAAMGARPLPDEHPQRAKVVEFAMGAMGATPVDRPPLTLTLARPSLTTGDELKLRSSLAGDRLSDRITWSTSDPRIATVDGEGNLVAHRPGLVTVTATTGEHRATALITVLSPDTEESPEPFVAPETARVGQPVTPPPDTRRTPAVETATPMPARAPSTLDLRRIGIAAAAVVVLGGGFVGVRALISGNDQPPSSDPISIEPAPPPVTTQPPMDTTTQVASGDTTRQTPVDTTRTQTIPTVPPAAIPPGTPEDGSLRIAGDLPAGAEVVIRGDGPARRWTGRDLSLPPGTYQVEATAPGYRGTSTQLRVQSGRTATWTPSLERLSAATPPPVVPPPPPPPPPPPTDSGNAASAEEQVRGVIEAFVRALERRDMNAIVRDFPGAGGDWANRWRGFYGSSSVRDLSARLDRADVQLSGNTARATFVVAADFSDARGRQQPRFNFTAEFQRGAAGWSLTSLQQTQ